MKSSRRIIENEEPLRMKSRNRTNPASHRQFSPETDRVGSHSLRSESPVGRFPAGGLVAVLFSHYHPVTPVFS